MFGDCPILDGRSVQGTDLAMIWFCKNVTVIEFQKSHRCRESGRARNCVTAPSSRRRLGSQYR
jgi:hypothetical protein